MMRIYVAALAFGLALVCLLGALLTVGTNLWTPLAWFGGAIIGVVACKLAVGPEDAE